MTTPLLRAPVELAGVLSFNLGTIAEGLALGEADVLAYFRDGRRAQPIVERRLVAAFGVTNGWRSETSVGGGRRLRKEFGRRGDGETFDVRVAARGLSFAPSWMKGTGRAFDGEAFASYYRTVTGVFVADAESFPEVPYWRVGALAVLGWLAEGRLGARASVKREDLPALLEGFKP